MPRNETFDYLANGPFCLVALDSETLRPTQVNGTFEELVGPLFKFQGYEFASAASDDLGHREKMAKAIDAVVNDSSSSVSEKRVVRNIEILTLVGDAGLPIRKHFDWTIWKGPDGSVMLFGDPCTTQDMEQRAKDDELIDFFQNAPIALHWLSGEGIVLWANKTEMDVLGYTEEEYIGQPIMKFCPDEEELVLEIFKQLGSGNAIRDVPVRFRTKDGRIVHLLVAKSSIASQGLKATDAPSVLIVDDTAMCVRLLSRMVTKMNFSATTAANGQEAVEILRNSMPGMFSLVLMDLRMPVMDGLEATRIIKHELKLESPWLPCRGKEVKT